MSADTLRSIEPMNSKSVRRATDEQMDITVKVANGDTATLEVENIEKGSSYQIEVEGNIPVSCSCKAFEFHCDESKNEVCKHAINYSIKAP